MPSMSFDAYLDAGCPPDVDWDLDTARSLSVQDIRAWRSSGETKHTLILQCEEYKAMEKTYYAAINKRRTPPVTFEEVEARWNELRPLVYEAVGRKFEQLPRPILRSFENGLIDDLPRVLKQQRSEAVDVEVLERRTKLWRMVLAQDGASNHPDAAAAFTVSSPQSGDARREARYTLTPRRTSRYEIPLQRIHISPFALPPHLAGIAPDAYSSDTLLLLLNSIFGTHVELDAALDAWLQDCIAEAWDLGKTYGYLRPWWPSLVSGLPFSEILKRMKAREEIVERRHAEVWDGGLIMNPVESAPRRIWDLYSNRVLPFHAVPSEAADDIFPSNVWAISHVWVPDEKRRDVWTAINAYEWPVPLPIDTTLDHVRIELLNMGAEYVFLDVLCLRQYGYSYAERVRQKEWEVDVPTLGNIYRHRIYQTTVVYFNGLGLPFDIHAEQLDSEYHWFNRAWTLQETPINWLPGGLTADLPGRSSGRLFMDNMRTALHIVNPSNAYLVDLVAAVHARRGFAQKKPVDRAAAFAYLYTAGSVPSYSETTSADETWRQAQSTANNGPGLVDLLARCPTVGDRSWVPSWDGALAGCAAGRCPPRPALRYDAEEQLSVLPEGQDRCYHTVFVLGRICRTTKGNKRRIVFKAGEDTTIQIKVYSDVAPSKDLILVGLAGLELWVVCNSPGASNPIADLKKYSSGMVLRKLTVGRLGNEESRRVLDGMRATMGYVRTVEYFQRDVK